MVSTRVYALGLLLTALASGATRAQPSFAPPPAFVDSCAMCHEVTPDAPPGPGPNLSGLNGRRAGTGGFAYSGAMRASGITWDRNTLLAFLEDPQGLIPGTTMVAPPITSATDRRAIADFLQLDTQLAESTLTQAAAAPGPGPAAPMQVQVSEQATFRLVPVADCLDHPWSMQFLPDGDLLVSERPGGLQRVRRTDGACSRIGGMPADVYYGGNQAGMHGLALHPQFASNLLVFIAYIAGDANSNRLRLVRFRLHGDTLVEPEILFESEERTRKAHSGGRLLFLPDGTLLLAVGHLIGEDLVSQALTETFGTIIRLTADGGIPADNPFVTRSGARPEIYTFGHRNPQGLTIRPGTGQVWAVEHGPMGGDELNLIVPGSNYGWPLATWGRNYDGSRISGDHRTGTVQPVWFWNPSIAPGSLAFYAGTAFPEWQDDLFVPALKAMHLERFEMDGNHVIGRETLLAAVGQRIRDIGTGPDGFIYLALDGSNGQIVRLEPATAPTED